MDIIFRNGLISEASLTSLNDFEQVKDAIIVAECEGVPFRGKPVDLARNALICILNHISSETGLFPVIIESCSGTDTRGDYTTKVVFQAVA